MCGHMFLRFWKMNWTVTELQDVQTKHGPIQELSSRSDQNADLHKWPSDMRRTGALQSHLLRRWNLKRHLGGSPRWFCRYRVPWRAAQQTRNTGWSIASQPPQTIPLAEPLWSSLPGRGIFSWLHHLARVVSHCIYVLTLFDFVSLQYQSLYRSACVCPL